VLARELDLKRQGAERGAKNLPNSAETTLDNVEQSIIQRVVSEWTYQGDELVNNLRAYNQRLVGYSIHAEHAKLALAAKNAITRLQNASVKEEGYLGPLRDGYLEARKEFEDFRQRNGLTRPARDPAGRWTTIGFLFVLISIESALNGFFFQKGSPLGIIGGISTAVGISITNIVFAFWLGLGPARFVNHRNILVRALAFLVVLVGACLLVALYAFAAHFRDAVELLKDDGSAALKAAIDHLKRAPVEVSDLNSAYIFGLNILFGVGAFWKGYKFDDPYPRYGSTYRRREKAREEYSEEHRLHFGDLEKEKENVVELLRDGIENLPRFPQLAGQILVERGALLQRFEAYELVVTVAVNHLLQIYRDENKDRRTTSPPAHFSETWSLPQSFLKSDKVQPYLGNPEEVPQNEIGKIIDEFGKDRDAVLEEYTKLMNKYPHPTDMR
jgi:hypothetical protein